MKKILITAVCALALMLLLVVPASAGGTCNIEIVYMCGGQVIDTEDFNYQMVLGGDADSYGLLTLDLPDGYEAIAKAESSSENVNDITFINDNEIKVFFSSKEAAVGANYEIEVYLSATMETLCETATLYTGPVDRTVDMEDLLLARNDYTDENAYAAAYKLNLKAGDIITASLAGSNGDETDCVLGMIDTDGDATYYDNDNLSDLGELGIYTAQKSGEYIVILMGYDEQETGTCRLQLRPAKSPLAFRSTTPSYTGAGFEWDLAKKTLTLFDGSDIDSDTGIVFDTDATIIVKGDVKFTSAANGIYANDVSVNITGEGADASSLTIASGAIGIYLGNYGDKKYEHSISGLTLNITAEQEGIFIDSEINDSLLITDCKLNIVANEEGIDTSYIVSLINCDTVIDASSNEEGIDVGELVVNGGKLKIVAMEDGIQTYGKLTLTNVEIDITATGDPEFDEGYYPLIFLDRTGFTIPGDIKLFSIDGKVIYEGKWDNKLLYDLTNGDLSSYNNMNISRELLNGELNGNDGIYVLGVTDENGDVTYAARVASVIPQPLPPTADPALTMMLVCGLSCVCVPAITLIKRKSR